MISWGQRLFNVQTPVALSEVNRQRETNIHNLEWFHGRDESGNRKSFWQLFWNGDRLFSFFWFTLCVFLPLVHRFNATARKFLKRTRLPVFSLLFSLLFMSNYLLAKGVEVVCPPFRSNAAEVKEAVCAFLFACLGAGEVMRRSGQRHI